MKVQETVYVIEAEGDIGLHHNVYTYEGAQFALNCSVILANHARQEGKTLPEVIEELKQSGYITLRPIDLLMTEKEADELAMATNDDQE